ncbi:MAG: UDP-3-O-(3-hydroxymyristoyl)glucosamine N-acyltransferase [Phycisphaeraceae bacterium]|nr:UDP-3-O-(3-hydroxymyristoyl)glucosamine N-acyltransferase [Phycisphaeraceae bacterium]
MPTFTAAEICQRVAGQLSGPAQLPLTGVDSLDRAGPGILTFIADAAYARLWPQSQASAALVQKGIDLPPDPSRALIVVPNADLAMAAVLEMFAPPLPCPEPGIHPSAIVHPSAQIDPTARVGARCYVGPRTRIEAHVILQPGVTILDDCHLGAHCVLWPGVVIRERCRLGSHCILHPNVTIGADGFGYRPAPPVSRAVPDADAPAPADTSAFTPGWTKIPQIGSVEIGSHVEIGAGTCVDRGKFSATLIGDGTKIDNLCQIAHNCRIGRNCILAGQVGLAGSVTLGDFVVIGGKVAVKDHVTIGSRVRLAACSAVMDDIPDKSTWGGAPAQDMRLALREYAAVRKLPDLIDQLKGRPERRKKE